MEGWLEPYFVGQDMSGMELEIVPHTGFVFVLVSK